MLLGSLAVDCEYRNQGIMGLLFDFILDKYSDEVDFFGLSGKFDRYKRFGFFPSEKIYAYKYNKKEWYYPYQYELVNDNNIAECIKIYEKLDFKVHRENMIDNLYMWEYKPYVIKKDNKILGYLVYNHRFNIIEEIFLNDYSLLDDIIYGFTSFINMDTSLKVSMANRFIVSYIDSNILYEEYFERTLYKILNPELKGIYVPRSDLI